MASMPRLVSLLLTIDAAVCGADTVISGQSFTHDTYTVTDPETLVVNCSFTGSQAALIANARALSASGVVALFLGYLVAMVVLRPYATMLVLLCQVSIAAAQLLASVLMVSGATLLGPPAQRCPPSVRVATSVDVTSLSSVR